MTKRKLPYVTTALPGHKILINVPNYWGSGATLDEAIDAMRKSGGRVADVWAIWSVAPGTCLDGLGNMCYPKTSPPVLLCQSFPFD